MPSSFSHDVPPASVPHMGLRVRTMPVHESYLLGEQDRDGTAQWQGLSVPAAAAHIIPDLAILNQKHKLLDLDIVRTHFLNEGRLSTRQALKILADADALLRREENLLRIDRKCHIVGDIHGQFYDLVSILAGFTFPADTLVFLGDYVDRGSFSTEVYLYLLLLKTYYPQSIFLLRGNHESRKMTSYFTFRSECLHKYSDAIYERMLQSFMCLPLAAVVQGKAFCCHGGISPELKCLADIGKINRFVEIEYRGLICDIMWSDPHAEYGSECRAWVDNHKRKCSFFYNYRQVCRFLDDNRLSTLIRGHEVQQEGYHVYEEHNGAPSLVTVFSAPNYCDVYNNMGALVEFDEGVVSVVQFAAVEHPFVLRGFIDGINWSLPFIFEKVLDLASSVFAEVGRAGGSDTESSDSAEQQAALLRAAADGGLAQDIPSIDEMKRPIAVMRTERESIDEFNDDEESTFDCGTLDVKETETESFQEAVERDAKNEALKDGAPGSPPLSLQLSPSLQTESLRGIGSGGPGEIGSSVVIETVCDDIHNVRFEALRPKKKRSWWRFCCLS